MRLVGVDSERSRQLVVFAWQLGAEVRVQFGKADGRECSPLKADTK
jgi:hypothetical protein